MPDSETVLRSFSYQRRRKNELYWVRKNKFYATTPFSGFVLINVARNKFEIIFWYLVVIIFTVMTIRDGSQLTTQYMGGQRKTTVTIVKDRESLVLPEFTICITNKWCDIHHDFECKPRKMKMVAQSSESHFKTGHSDSETITENIETPISLLSKVFQKLDTKEKFLGNSWDFVVLPFVQKLYSFQTAFEDQRLDPELLIFVKFDETMHFDYGTQFFLKHLNNLNITMRELMAKFEFEIINHYYLDVQTIQGESDGDKIYPKLVSMFTSGKQKTEICFRYSNSHGANNLQIRIWQDSIIDYLKKYDWDVKLSDMQIYFGDFFRDRNAQPQLEVEEGEIGIGRVSIVSAFKSIDNCSEQHFSDCTFNCILDKFKDLCECVPLMIPFLSENQKNTPICTPIELQQCAMDNVIITRILHEHTSNCNCKTACELKIFQTQSRTRELSASATPGDIVAELYVISEEYPVFQEEASQSRESFIGEMGGVIDFWLGASVIGVVHLFVYFAKQLIYIFNRRTKTGRHVRRMMTDLRPDSFLAGTLVQNKGNEGEFWDDDVPSLAEFMELKKTVNSLAKECANIKDQISS